VTTTLVTLALATVDWPPRQSTGVPGSGPAEQPLRPGRVEPSALA
jgi:hypothetical protein